MNDDFWHCFDELLAGSPIVIDRPKGSCHPSFPDAVYPLDYGYLQGTHSADGYGVDVWIGTQGDRKLMGIACTYDTLKKDAEIKLLAGCSEKDIQCIIEFYGQRMKTLIIRRSP